MVAALLQSDPAVVEEAMAAPSAEADRITVETHLALQAGDFVALLGDMLRPREVWESELRAQGYQPWGGVTRKVWLVVGADPDSISGEARIARDNGLPIIDEQTLERILTGGGSVALA